MSSPSPITYFLNEDSIPVLRAMIAGEPGKGSINTYRHQERNIFGTPVVPRLRSSTPSPLLNSSPSSYGVDEDRPATEAPFPLRRGIPGTQPMPTDEELVRVFHTQTPSITTSTPPLASSWQGLPLLLSLPLWSTSYPTITGTRVSLAPVFPDPS